MFKVPNILGIINITPDSFSDGNKYLSYDNAIEQAQYLIDLGVNVIDIGAESTRPRSHDQMKHLMTSDSDVSSDQEWGRLKNILPTIIDMAKKNNILVSLDTRNAENAQKAIDLGVDWINDVSGCNSLGMIDLLKRTNVKIVIMHNLGIPADPKCIIDPESDVVAVVLDWLESKLELLESHGISRNRCIVDPGIGFGKSAIQSLELIRNVDRFKKTECQILIGHSRKSFFNIVTNKPFAERDIETYITSVFLSKQEVDFIRVHDVEGNMRSLKIANCLYGKS